VQIDLLVALLDCFSRAAKRPQDLPPVGSVNLRLQDCEHDADYRALDKAISDFSGVIFEVFVSETVKKASQCHENDDDEESSLEAFRRRDVQEVPVGRGHWLFPPSSFDQFFQVQRVVGWSKPCSPCLPLTHFFDKIEWQLGDVAAINPIEAKAIKIAQSQRGTYAYPPRTPLNETPSPLRDRRQLRHFGLRLSKRLPQFL